MLQSSNIDHKRYFLICRTSLNVNVGYDAIVQHEWVYIPTFVRTILPSNLTRTIMIERRFFKRQDLIVTISEKKKNIYIHWNSLNTNLAPSSYSFYFTSGSYLFGSIRKFHTVPVVRSHQIQNWHIIIHNVLMSTALDSTKLGLSFLGKAEYATRFQELRLDTSKKSKVTDVKSLATI